MKLHKVGLEDLTTFRDQLREEERLLEEANIHASIAGDDLVYSLLSRLRSARTLASMTASFARAFGLNSSHIVAGSEGKTRGLGRDQPPHGHVTKGKT